MEEDEGDDEAEQPTLTDILRAVYKCTASGHTLQEQGWGLKEELGFICHDTQKVRVRTTAAEGRIEDKLTPLIRDTQITARLARAKELKSDDIVNRLRPNDFRIVGLPEKTEGRDPTEFVENWLLEVFEREVFTSPYLVEWAHRAFSTRPSASHPLSQTP